MWWETVSLNIIVIVVGALLGSIKANFNDKEQKTNCVRLINIVIGVFCGISVALHYEVNLATWLVGLVALTASMLSVSVLDTLYLATPTVTKLIIKVYTTGLRK